MNFFRGTRRRGFLKYPLLVKFEFWSYENERRSTFSSTILKQFIIMALAGFRKKNSRLLWQNKDQEGTNKIAQIYLLPWNKADNINNCWLETNECQCVLKGLHFIWIMGCHYTSLTCRKDLWELIMGSGRRGGGAGGCTKFTTSLAYLLRIVATGRMQAQRKSRPQSTSSS